MKRISRKTWLRWGRHVVETGGLLLLLIGLMLWLAGAFVEKVEAGAPRPSQGERPQSTITVEEGTVTVDVTFLGQVRARRESVVASQLLARVEEVAVDVGDLVEGPSSTGAGTLLVRLDKKDLAAARARAEATLAGTQAAITVIAAEREAASSAVVAAEASAQNAAADLARYESLFAKGVATREQIDAGRTQARIRAAELDVARQRLTTLDQKRVAAEMDVSAAREALLQARVAEEWSEVTAPFSGVVVAKHVDVGAMASPGGPLVTVLDTSAFDFEVHVSESLAARIDIGDSLSIRIDALERDLAAEVREIEPRVRATSRTVVMKLALMAGDDLREGLSGRVRLPVAETAAILIPRTAVRHVGQLSLVEVVDGEGIARRRFVTLGRPRDDRVEVLSGLAPGERVVVR